MMDLVPIVAAVLGVILLVFLLLRSKRSRQASMETKAASLDTLGAWQPQATRILTGEERKAHGILTRAFPDHLILAQVPLSRFIRVPKRHSYVEWLRRVGQLSPDLLICDIQSNVIAAVDVQPPEGQGSARSLRRLERMQRVLQGAGIPLHVWTEAALPTPQIARTTIIVQIQPEPAVALATEAALQSITPASPAEPAHQPGPVTLDLEPDQVIEMREPPPSTWFDDLDAGSTPPATKSR